MTGVTQEVADRRRVGKHPALAASYKRVEVVEEADVSAKILASSIVSIAEGMKRLRTGALADRALLILIQDACPEKIGLDKIRMVLDAIGDLRKKFVRARILSVGSAYEYDPDSVKDRECVYFWFQCDPEAEKTKRVIQVCRTGQGSTPPADDSVAKFIGTLQLDDGFVVHIFERFGIV
jgi:hypothetical protein